MTVDDDDYYYVNKTMWVQSTLYSLISTSFSWHCRLANAQAHIFYMLFVLIHFSEDARKKNLRKKKQ